MLIIQPEQSRLLLVVFFISIALSAVNPAWAQTGLCNTITKIQIPSHSSKAVVHGAVARGEIACWSIYGHVGQKMVITVSSPESIARFQLYRPGWRLVVRDQGALSVDGQAYPGTGDSDDAKAWRGVLSQDGDQLITVGATRGGTSYDLQLSIEH